MRNEEVETLNKVYEIGVQPNQPGIKDIVLIQLTDKQLCGETLHIH